MSSLIYKSGDYDTQKRRIDEVEELYSHEIEEFVESRRVKGSPAASVFRGVYAINQLPENTLASPFTLIVNTQTSNLPGLHWIGVWMDEDRLAEVFDPLAQPTQPRLRKWLYSQKALRIVRNYRMVQHPRSSVCGHFVLVYVLRRPRYKNLKDFLNTELTRSMFLNTKIVKNFYNDK